MNIIACFLRMLFILMSVSLSFACTESTPPIPQSALPIPQKKLSNTYCTYINQKAFTCEEGDSACPPDGTKIICNGYSFLGGFSDDGSNNQVESINNWKKKGFWNIIKGKIIFAHVHNVEKNKFKIISDHDKQPQDKFYLNGYDNQSPYVIIYLTQYDQNFMIDDLYGRVISNITKSDYEKIKGMVELKNLIYRIKNTDGLEKQSEEQISDSLRVLERACEEIHHDKSQGIAYERYMNFSCQNLKRNTINILSEKIKASINESRVSIGEIIETLSNKGKGISQINTIGKIERILDEIEKRTKSEFIKLVLPDPVLEKEINETVLFIAEKRAFFNKLYKDTFSERMDLALSKKSLRSSDSYVNMHMDSYNKSKSCTPSIDTSSNTYSNVDPKSAIFEVSVNIKSVEKRKGSISVDVEAVSDKVALHSKYHFRHESSPITMKRCCVDPFGLRCETVLLWCSDGYDYTYREIIGYNHSYTFIPKPLTIKYKADVDFDVRHLSVRYFGHLVDIPSKCVNEEVSDYGQIFSPVATFLIHTDGDKEEVIASNVKYAFSPESFLKSVSGFQEDYMSDIIESERLSVLESIKSDLEKKFNNADKKALSVELAYQPKGNFFIGKLGTLEKNIEYTYVLRAKRLNKKGVTEWRKTQRKKTQNPIRSSGASLVP